MGATGSALGTRVCRPRTRVPKAEPVAPERFGWTPRFRYDSVGLAGEYNGKVSAASWVLRRAHERGLEPMTVMRCMEIRGGIQPVEEAFATPGLDGWLSSRPYQDAAGGGDVHYVSLCGGGLITRLILADVSGHGAGAAGTATRLRNLMRRFINSKNQMALVRALNREFTHQAQEDLFATAIVATYLAHRRRLTVCNAGHPAPLWYQADARTWRFLNPASLSAANLPFGIDLDAPYQQFSIPLAPGNALVLYTDGVTEALNRDGRLLTEEGLLAHVGDLVPSDGPIALGSALREAVRHYRDGRPPDDDESVLVLHHNGRGPRRLSVPEKIDVLAKVFRLKAV